MATANPQVDSNFRIEGQRSNFFRRWWKTLFGITFVFLALGLLAYLLSSSLNEKKVAQRAPNPPASAPSTGASAASAPASAANAPAQAASAVAQAPASASAAPAKAGAKEPSQPGKVAKIVTEPRHVFTHKVVTERFGFMRVADNVGPMYYPSRDNCEAAWHAERAVEYHPTMRNKSFGPARIEGMSLRGGEAPACARMETAAGSQWVYFPQGKPMYWNGEKVTYLAECQNEIYEIHFLKKEVVVPPAPPAPVATCDTCGVVQMPPVKVLPPKECETEDGKRYPIVNGVCQLPTVTPLQPVRPQVQQVPCCMQAVPQASAPPAPVAVPAQPQGCPGGNCAPPRRTEVGGNGICRIKAGTNRVPECNFPWKVLHTQDDILNCGCQILIPSPRQIVGFPDAMPGSPRCLEQKRLFTQALGVQYNDARGN